MIHYPRKVSPLDVAAGLNTALVGCSITGIQRREHDWAVSFSGGTALGITCFWRILVAGRISLTREDDRQQFGLPIPVDAEEEARKFLYEKVIESVAIRDGTSDLTISLKDTTTLELINDSSGYEGWHLTTSSFALIALGGGELAIYNT